MLKTGQTIAALRTKANMTQEQLAAALFVSRDLVSKWETGKSPPNYQMILKMAFDTARFHATEKTPDPNDRRCLRVYRRSICGRGFRLQPLVPADAVRHTD